MSDAPKLVGTDTLKVAYPKINSGIDNANAALKLSRGSYSSNKGIDFPLKNMTFRGSTGAISTTAKNVILDAKVFGAKVDCYYKLDFVSNGYVSNGKARYGITLLEYRKSDFETTGYRTAYVFIYNDDAMLGNQGNATWLNRSGASEVASLSISAVPTAAGNVTVTLHGISKTIPIDPAVETTTDAVATKIRGTAFDGWTTGGSGSTVTFTSTSSGNKKDATYSSGSTGATGAMSTTTQGTDGIETITIDNGDIAVSITLDRAAIGAEFLNLNSTHAPTAIIDPANYFF